MYQVVKPLLFTLMRSHVAFEAKTRVRDHDRDWLAVLRRRAPKFFLLLRHINPLHASFPLPYKWHMANRVHITISDQFTMIMYYTQSILTTSDDLTADHGHLPTGYTPLKCTLGYSWLTIRKISEWGAIGWPVWKLGE